MWIRRRENPTGQRLASYSRSGRGYNHTASQCGQSPMCCTNPARTGLVTTYRAALKHGRYAASAIRRRPEIPELLRTMRRLAKSI